MRVLLASASVAAVLLPAGIAGATGGTAAVTVSNCPGQNAEVEQAVDGSYVYEVWIGCKGIGFARSVDAAASFGPSRVVLGSVHRRGFFTWDPALTVGPDGTVYVAYMVLSRVDTQAGPRIEARPSVAVSHDHGQSFASVARLPIPAPMSRNWGDRDFIAVGPDGTVYVTWDFGPRAGQVELTCAHGGSCSFRKGDFNAVVQKSPDGGKTWTRPARVSPGFPLGGVFSAPIVAEPDGALDVLYLGHPTNAKTLAVSPGREYFTRSTDGGKTWSPPVLVGAQAGRVALGEWWIDGSLAVDPAGTLYATWDTQHGSTDTAWLAWSTDGGQTWSTPLQVTSSRSGNLVETAAAGPNDVYVAWQTVVHGHGYAIFARRLAVGQGWTSAATRVSAAFGNARIWPGDTFGLSTAGGAAILSWGSANGRRKTSEIYSKAVTLPAG